jgi:hypothetical protein
MIKNLLLRLSLKRRKKLTLLKVLRMQRKMQRELKKLKKLSVRNKP